MPVAEIEQWCDNKRAIVAAAEPIRSPSGMVGADADIIMAIHHLQSKMG